MSQPAFTIPQDQLPALVQAMPKAELHMHIEGSIEPELFLQLAERNQVEVRWKDVQSLRAAYDFQNLQTFLDLYYDGCRVLVHAQDFHDVTRAYLRKAHADGVIHAELFLGPQGHTLRGVAMATVLEGVLSAMRAAQLEDGVSSGLILLAQRHRTELALRVRIELQALHRAAQARRHRRRGRRADGPQTLPGRRAHP